jgi:S-adenosylmethionine:tRNA ribosyltransferase-isomerase
MQASAPSSPASIDLDDYDFDLPQECIAQQPIAVRDASKLLVVDRDAQEPATALRHSTFNRLSDWLEPNDLLVVNATRVEPARLRGQRDTGGAVEALLLSPLPDADATSLLPVRYRAMLKISGKLRTGIAMCFGPEEGALPAEVISLGERGEVILGFEAGADPYAVGEPPLPPYIRRPDSSEAEEDRERYQTIYARVPGAIAAPTAGLHFSENLFAELEARGIRRTEVVLHVGAGTFRPLDEASLSTGKLHNERFELSPETAAAIAQTRERGGRVVAVGTTSARVLEASAKDARLVAAGAGETDIFIRPGSKFGVVDALITNFHLPRSSLLLLVAAFAGREKILAAYNEAIANNYRFYSYGDAMLIL